MHIKYHLVLPYRNVSLYLDSPTSECLPLNKEKDKYVSKEITEAELRERGKNDSFARSITAVHGIYFVILTFGRLGSGLPISELEVATLPFVCFGAAKDLFW